MSQNGSRAIWWEGTQAQQQVRMGQDIFGPRLGLGLAGSGPSSGSGDGRTLDPQPGSPSHRAQKQNKSLRDPRCDYGSTNWKEL